MFRFAFCFALTHSFVFFFSGRLFVPRADRSIYFWSFFRAKPISSFSSFFLAHLMRSMNLLRASVSLIGRFMQSMRVLWFVCFPPTASFDGDVIVVGNFLWPWPTADDARVVYF